MGEPFRPDHLGKPCGVQVVVHPTGELSTLMAQKKPGRPQEKVSLHPLDFKEAVADLLKVRPQPTVLKKRKTGAPDEG